MVTEGITADNIGDCFAADVSGIRRNGRPRRGKPAGGRGFFSERGGVESVISFDTGLKCFYNCLLVALRLRRQGMKDKAEAKLRTRFSVVGKTPEDGRSPRDAHDGPDGSRFHDTPPPISI